jgi:hypothetical protein
MKLANIVHIGLVKEIDYQKARVRVKVGELLTNWLLWITFQAGEKKVDDHLILMSTEMGMADKVRIYKGYKKS